MISDSSSGLPSTATPDTNGAPYVPSPDLPSPLPPSVDLRPSPWPVWSQAGMNSCTSQAVAAAIELLEIKENLAAPITPSRLFLYYNERVLENDVGQDAPARICDALAALSKYGICSEEAWPYVQANELTQPPPEVYALALQHSTVQYASIAQDLTLMKSCLAEGYAFTVGIQTYNSYLGPRTMNTGVIPKPDVSHETLIGGHALLVVGYDDARGVFIVRNSRGTHWASESDTPGYGTLPYDYATDTSLSDAFWTLRYTD